MAYIALLLLQIAPLTALYDVWFYGAYYPPITAAIFILALGILTIHSIVTKERIYLYANIAGCLINLLILYKVMI